MALLKTSHSHDRHTKKVKTKHDHKPTEEPQIVSTPTMSPMNSTNCDEQLTSVTKIVNIVGTDGNSNDDHMMVTPTPTPKLTPSIAKDMRIADNPFVVNPPRTHVTSWKIGEVFTADQDPDRINIPWTPPTFVTEKDPATQHARLTVEELRLPPGTSGMSMNVKGFARVVHNVLEPEECAALIACVNTKGFTPALVNVGGGRQEYDPSYRNSGRCVIDHTGLAEYIHTVLQPHLPRRFYEGTKAEMVVDEVNERCRFLCYKPGDEFSPHCDGSYYRPPDHPKAGSKSIVTVQLYLHNVPKSHGGATTFIGSAIKAPCQPRCGSVLLFTQDLYHEGSRLHSGLKYTMRSEVMYSLVASTAKQRKELQPKELASNDKDKRREELRLMQMEDGWSTY